MLLMYNMLKIIKKDTLKFTIKCHNYAITMKKRTSWDIWISNVPSWHCIGMVGSETRNFMRDAGLPALYANQDIRPASFTK